MENVNSAGPEKGAISKNEAAYLVLNDIGARTINISPNSMVTNKQKLVSTSSEG